ncbi:MAG: hypothetical protein GX061_05150, partial [Eubacteriaceae bacterium]|nr:hypothetical protein [Eubacteriaceae bacterium]
MPENNDTMPNENENQKAQVRNEVNIHKVKAEKNKNALQIVLTVMFLVVSALILKLSDLSGEIPVDTQSGLILINEISSSSQ